MDTLKQSSEARLQDRIATKHSRILELEGSVSKWEARAEALWKLLDDIDTASDMFKPSDLTSYKAFYRYVMKKAEDRHEYLRSLDGQTLVVTKEG